MTRLSLPIALVAAALLSACATRPAAAPRPAPVEVRPVPPLPAAIPVAPAGDDWRDLELTPGEWRYLGASAEATYSAAGGSPVLTLACEADTRRVRLTRMGATSALTVRTSYGVRSLGAGGTGRIDASDPLLDEIAFSRGRFTVETAGQPMLVLPAWPEPARVIEDCRG